jgi:hypothetical protein
VVRCCEHDNEMSGSIKLGELFDYMRAVSSAKTALHLVFS